MSDSATPWTVAHQGLLGSFVHGDSPGKNTGVGCHALLQGNLPNPGIKPRSSTLQAILDQLSHQGSPRVLEWVDFLNHKNKLKTLKINYSYPCAQVLTDPWPPGVT